MWNDAVTKPPPLAHEDARGRSDGHIDGVAATGHHIDAIAATASVRATSRHRRDRSSLGHAARPRRGPNGLKLEKESTPGIV